MSKILDDLISSGKTEKVSAYNDVSNFNDISGKIKSLETVIDNFTLSDFTESGNSISMKRNGTIREPDFAIRKTFGKCSVCGKTLEAPSADGFCSLECRVKGYAVTMSRNIEEFREKILAVNDRLKSVSAAMTEFLAGSSDILTLKTRLGKGITSELDNDEYVWSTVELYKALLKLRRKMNICLIQKNDMLMKIIESTRDGISTGDILSSSYLSNVRKLYTLGNKMQQELNDSYKAIYNSVISKFKSYSFSPESMYFFKTRRSEYKKPGCNLIGLSAGNSGNSILESVNIDPLRETIQKDYPDLTEKEYFEDASVFKERLEKTSLNEAKITRLFSELGNAFKCCSEPLPKYSDLKVSNKEWLYFLLSSWGSNGKIAYGYPMYP